MIPEILDSPGAALVRFWLWNRDANRDSQAAQKFATRHEKKLVDIYRSPILDSSASKTLFILGSGWSVNELTDGMLRHMGDHQSVGINFWFFHHFVPTAFSFDAGKVPEDEEAHVRASMVALGGLFARREISDLKPKVLYLRPYRSEPDYLVPCPPELDDLSWVSGRANLLAKSPGSVETDLRLLTERTVLGKLPSAALPDNGSSAVRLIFLALAQGFSDIVLVGIDLDSRPHFWFAPQYRERYPEHVNLFPDPDGQPHGTTEPTNRAIGNEEFLGILGKVFSELGVAKLWVGSPSSQLAEDLALYPWPSEGFTN
jgi:hypothetical protein